MINEIGIYESNGDLRSVEQIGALGTNVSVNVNGLNSNDANSAIEELNGKIGELDESVGQNIDEVNQSVTELEKKLGKSGETKVQDELCPLEVGKLISGSVASGWVPQSDDTTLISRSLFSFPLPNLTYTVHVDYGYKAALAYGTLYGSVTLSDFVTNGGTITPSSSFYRVVVKKSNDGAFEENEQDSIGLTITYKNTPAAWPISACVNLQTKAQLSRLENASKNGKLPTIGHISDTHSDSVRTQRFLDFCEDMGITCACITGDYAFDGTSNSPFYWLPEMVSKCKCNVMVTTGNHDGTNAEHWSMTYKEMSDKLHLYGNMSYYKDFPSAKLRIISVDQPKSGGYTKAIENWLCEAVLGTPANFGLLIQYHIPETRIYGDLPEGRDKSFFTVFSGEATDWYSTWNQMIQQIVDAFISGSVYRKLKTTVVENGETVGEPFSFSGKNSGAVFVAHVTGHMHFDAIFDLRDAKWYDDQPTMVRPTNKQIMLNVTKGQGVGISNYKQDIFNVYTIDLEEEKIHVVRIGNDSRTEMTIKFTD